MVGHKGVHRSLEVLEVPLVTAQMEARLEEWVLFSRGWRFSEARAENSFLEKIISCLSSQACHGLGATKVRELLFALHNWQSLSQHCESQLLLSAQS